MYANQMLSFVPKAAVIPLLRLNGAKIGDKCDIETNLTFHNCTDFSNLVIGENCHIGKNCFFDLRDKITINDNVVISMQCTFITHLDLSKSKLAILYPKEHKPVTIHHNCYIGARSTILMGVELGENCIIAAGSMVTESMDANTLAGGVPSVVKKRIEI
jgi:acetyltransferase-like isoleucine patch superfamily enzyme